ncbi:MAG TPA: VOC family protein [Solirubrobacterales bacterium]|nr:VOC family protein [Solirubrobacterales bacterium]
MSERTSYVPGTPCWVDLATPDIEAAERFYGELFGWEIPELPNSAEMGGYRRAKLGGRDVAGAMPLQQEGQPPAWSTYISVDDIEALGRAVQENDGTMIAEPMAVASYGRLALFTDPEGAFFGMWEPADFAGAELVNEKGTFGWNELETRDPAAAKRFYGTVFGWEFEEEQMGEMTYNVATVDGVRVAGMADVKGRIPDEVPAHWMVYFGSVDTDEAVEKIKQLGGQVMFGPIDIPAGRFAMVTDPQGAAFSVMQPSEQTLARAEEQGQI